MTLFLEETETADTTPGEWTVELKENGVDVADPVSATVIDTPRGRRIVAMAPLFVRVVTEAPVIYGVRAGEIRARVPLDMRLNPGDSVLVD